MSYTLNDILQNIYEALGQLTVTTATGGAATNAVDSRQVGQHKDEAWKDGALFVIAADGAAPEGEFKRIGGYTDSSGTFILESALTSAIASGDTFGFASDQYPLFTMIELANAGLRALGDIALVDTATLDTASGTTEYAASVAWKRGRPLMIDLQGRTGAAGDNRWRRIFDWEFVPASPGSTGLIIFKHELPAGRDLRVWYLGSHPRLNAYDDVISETIAPELAVAAGVERALRWANSRLGGGDPFMMQRWNDAKIELARAKAEFPIWRPRRVNRLMKIVEGS